MTSAQLTLRDLLFRRCHNFGKRVWQHEIAAEAGIEQSVFSRIITGIYAVKSEQLPALAKALRCSIQEVTAAIPPSLLLEHNIYDRSLSDVCTKGNKRARGNGNNRARACKAQRKARK